MPREQLSVMRGGSPVARRATRTAAVASAAESNDASALHPLAVIALASSLRLDDPRSEDERIALLGTAIDAGREAARALDTWVTQSMAEYRGSRSAWDLQSTSARLRAALSRYDATMRETCERLRVLIPGLAGGTPGSTGARP